MANRNPNQTFYGFNALGLPNQAQYVNPDYAIAQNTLDRLYGSAIQQKGFYENHPIIGSILGALGTGSISKGILNAAQQRQLSRDQRLATFGAYQKAIDDLQARGKRAQELSQPFFQNSLINNDLARLNSQGIATGQTFLNPYASYTPDYLKNYNESIQRANDIASLARTQDYQNQAISDAYRLGESQKLSNQTPNPYTRKILPQNSIQPGTPARNFINQDGSFNNGPEPIQGGISQTNNYNPDQQTPPLANVSQILPGKLYEDVIKRNLEQQGSAITKGLENRYQPESRLASIQSTNSLTNLRDLQAKYYPKLSQSLINQRNASAYRSYNPVNNYQFSNQSFLANVGKTIRQIKQNTAREQLIQNGFVDKKTGQFVESAIRDNPAVFTKLYSDFSNPQASPQEIYSYFNASTPQIAAPPAPNRANPKKGRNDFVSSAKKPGSY